MNVHNPRCFNSHMGVWLAKPDVIESKHKLIQSGLIRARDDWRTYPGEGESEVEKLGIQTFGPVAVIPIDDVMMKKESKFGGCSTIAVRRKLRACADEQSIERAILYVNSPGGHVEGQAELVDDIRAFAEEKWIGSYISDMGCSAAYWAAAVTRFVCCNRMAVVGSIGAYVVLYDTSKMAEMEGLKVIRVASGEKKGLGVGGTEIDQLVIDEVQKDVDKIHAFFVEDVMAGRPGWGGTPQDGSVLYGSEALQAGLVDEVDSFDNFLIRVIEGEGMTEEERDDTFIQSKVKSNSDTPTIVAQEDEPADEEDDEEEGDGEDKDERIRELEQENAELRGRLEELEKVDGLDSESQEGETDEEEDDEEEDESDMDALALSRLKAAFKSRGISIKGKSLDETVAQLAAINGKTDGLPKSEKTGMPENVAAKKKLREYQAEYGVEDGGAKFRRKEPKLYEALVAHAGK